MQRARIICAAAWFFVATTTHAEDPSAQSKRGFHLFNPTPRALMREMSTDRPDVTESPFTVDAGHFQIETDLISTSYDRHNTEHTNTRAASTSIAAVNFKAGLAHNADLQIVLPFYNSVRTSDRTAGQETRNDGFGDLAVRLKMNLWGNDGGRTAGAIMPFIKIPTAQDDLGNGAVEGGVILPLAVALPGGWGMGLMAEFDFNEDGDGRGRHTAFVDSITFSHSIAGNLGGYVEFVSILSTERGADWVATVDLGLTYGLTDDIQLDAGVNVGVTRAADDVQPFVGISWRF